MFTTTYPRDTAENVPMFVADGVRHLRRQGVDIEVVGPGVYRDYGLTSFTGRGFVGNLKRRPWLLPPALFSMVRVLRSVARDADLVHAHWLWAALVARLAGKPFIVTLWGTGSAGSFGDLELARRAPWLVRRLLARARVVICVSERLAQAMHECGITNARVIPSGVEIPHEVPDPEYPPAVLYAGRLSTEKGIDVLAEATSGMTRIIAGDGPLRHLVPDALGFVSHSELETLYQRASIVVLTSRSEGLPVVMLEAMAYGRPVVATAVGGIPSVITDGVTGLLVPPGDAAAVRGAIERLLADTELRRRIGRAARDRVKECCSWEHVTQLTVAAYEDALKLRR